VIQGDGVSLQTIEAILAAMKLRKQSAENVAFGMGGELLQKVNRDTMKFAMKASAAMVGGLWRDVYKDPITDAGKRSKKGRLAVIQDENGVVKTIRSQDLGEKINLLQPVFRNGQLLTEYDFEEVRRNAQSATIASDKKGLITAA
jgi:nicotinamide phosphoribosyltransferase